MGAVASKQDDIGHIYLRDQQRRMVDLLFMDSIMSLILLAVAVTSIRITNARGRVLYRISPNTLPATRYAVKREGDDEAVVEYVLVRAIQIPVTKQSLTLLGS